jgi:hypothetical protein
MSRSTALPVTEFVALIPSSSASARWTVTVLYEFQFIGGPQGGYITGLVVSKRPGGLPFFYGLTSTGGDSNLGAMFLLEPATSPGGSWTETDRYSFTGGSDTSNPAGLTRGGDGIFYGVTEGAPSENGPRTAFSLTPPASPGGFVDEQVLYTFYLSDDRGPPWGVSWWAVDLEGAGCSTAPAGIPYTN